MGTQWRMAAASRAEQAPGGGGPAGDTAPRPPALDRPRISGATVTGPAVRVGRPAGAFTSGMATHARRCRAGASPAALAMARPRRQPPSESPPGVLRVFHDPSSSHDGNGALALQQCQCSLRQFVESVTEGVMRGPGTVPPSPALARQRLAVFLASFCCVSTLAAMAAREPPTLCASSAARRVLVGTSAASSNICIFKATVS